MCEVVRLGFSSLLSPLLAGAGSMQGTAGAD